METRTGDTPSHKRQRQKLLPPDILLTTPEQLALLLASKDAERFFAGLQARWCSTSSIRWSPPSAAICFRWVWRGCAASRPTCAPSACRRPWPSRRNCRRWLVAQDETLPMADSWCRFKGGAKPEIRILDSKGARSVGRAFGALFDWRASTRRSEAHKHDAALRQYAQPGRAPVPGTVARQRGHAAHRAPSRFARCRPAPQGREGHGDRFSLRAIVATSTLDLGIDWGDVDLVVHVGAPKGASRLAQRIGRSNHRLDEPKPGDPGAGQPFRGAGVPGRHRGELSGRPGHAAARRRRARRAWPSM
jgi:ATP-dependent helicase Lhr and Lhr-like helicase